MKKFLTVLLALSVVFTYTVGTAFAAVPGDPEDQLSSDAAIKQVEKAYENAKTELLSAKTEALKVIFGTTGTEKTAESVTIDKKAVETVYNAEYYDKALAQAKTEYETALNYINDGIAKGAEFFFATTTPGELGYQTADKACGFDDTFSLETPTVGVTLGVAANEAAYKALFSYDSGSDEFTSDADGKDKVAIEQAKIVKNDTKDAIRKINASDYSTKPLNSTLTKSSFALAGELVDAALVAVDAQAMPTEFAGLAAYVTAIKGIYIAPVNNADPAASKLYDTTGGGLLESPYDGIGLKHLLKVGNEMTEEAKLAWAKNAALNSTVANKEGLVAKINASLAATKTYYNNEIVNETLKGSKADTDKIASYKAAIEKAEKQAAAAIEIATYLVNDCDDYSKLVTTDEGTFTDNAPVATYNQSGTTNDISDDIFVLLGKTYNMSPKDKEMDVLAIAKLVADLKEEAEVLKGSEMIDGATAADIDKALEKAIDDAYKTGKAELGFADTAINLYNRQYELIGKSAGTVKVSGTTYPAVNAWTDGLADVYDAKYFADVKKAVKDAKAAIFEATTMEAANNAFLEAYKAFDAVPTKADKRKAQATAEFANTLAQYKADIKSYVEYKEKSITNANETSKYDWNPTTMYTYWQGELDKAYTVDELKATLAEAKAAVDGLKTNAELTDAKGALDTRIKALPGTITVADKETVATLKADVEDHNDYCAMIGRDSLKVIVTSPVTGAYDTIQKAEAKAVKDQYDAIWKDGKVTTDEADAVKALRNAFDAFVEYYSDPEAVNATVPTPVTEVLMNATEVALDNAQIKAFNNMVAVLPADGSDIAGIKAAKDAYDALSYDAKMTVYQGKYYDKLVDLQKLLVKNVESMKITASSKAGKGYIKVTWKTKGVSAAADGYQVYRSTKRNSGYGTKPYFTTKNKTYKNTKSLKKGTRYYYKVRAYVEIDGQKYYSDWSNKAYRIAK